MENEHCPLCRQLDSLEYSKDKNRLYLQCQNCLLIFVGANNLLNSDEEKKIYSFHENNFEDPNYRKFLYKLLTPLLKNLKHGWKGLDYGCGPGPAISHYLKEEGYQVNNFDPFFANNKSMLQCEYDFITCTEVIEHIYEVKESFEKMLSLISDKGILGVMTQFPPEEQEKFKSWWYKNDPTHVRFFSKKTLDYMAKNYNLDMEIHGESVAIFKKR
jgi:2-polyprenyl-3-methyl-5-hydroxy-6-metoxy-1,4-benzoquinol methylase